MSRKKSQPDEIESMGKVYMILRDFGPEQRDRMMNWVNQRIEADKPKKRVRKAAVQTTSHGTPDIVGAMNRAQRPQ